MDEEEDNNVRAPDQVVTGSLYDDSDIPDTLADRINQLLSHGLSPEEAEAIARSQMETARNESRIMNLENTVEILKEQMKAKERERQRINKLASESSSSDEEAELELLETKVNANTRSFKDETILLKIKEALQNKRDKLPMLEITDAKLRSIEEEINEVVKNPIKIIKQKGLAMSKKDVDAILELFTTPIHGDSDYEYNSGNESDYDGYDTSGGRRTRKARKSRKSRKSKKNKKSKKTRKNKRK